MKNHKFLPTQYFFTVMLLLAFSSENSFAQTETGQWTGARLIQTDNVSSAFNPQITMNANYNAIAVWQQWDGARYNIWANRYTDDSGWGTATLIETDNGSAFDPQIAMDANNNAIVVWQQWDGARYNIWANRYTAGSGWGTAALIETGDGIASGPKIAMDADGNAIAVGQQVSAPSNVYNIWANRYTAGSGWGTAALIDTSATSPQIAMDASGNAIAVYTQTDGTFWTNHYTAGSGWGTRYLIETGNTGSAFNPQIAMDANNNAIVVWQQWDGARYNIWANRYTAGSGWGTAALIETGDGIASGPKIDKDTADNAIAVWQQVSAPSNVYNIWANRYTAGSGWGTAALIDTSATSPQIAMDASGNAIAVYTQTDGTFYNIWTNHYTAGSGWGTSNLIETGSAGDASSPQIAMLADGNAIAVWQQWDGWRYNIWANRFVPACYLYWYLH